MYTYKTKGTCSRQITVELDGEIIKRVEFLGGCAGNTKGISQIVKGMNAREVIKVFKGIDCHSRGTSCPDQLAKALEEALSLS
ncbi:MAG: TIGR03905 family TSCPD domain-containing protein [Oscillospiraceae bacterium]|nr:TIGR03905 family TSCPD domain-containing protein [Oscillospiraceae bacterium]